MGSHQEEKSSTGDFSPSPKENKKQQQLEKVSTHRTTIITKVRPSSRTSQVFVLGIARITPRPVPSSVLGMSITQLMTISASDTTEGPARKISTAIVQFCHQQQNTAQGHLEWLQALGINQEEFHYASASNLRQKRHFKGGGAPWLHSISSTPM